MNSSLGICRIYFLTSTRISGSRLILRMEISPSSQRYGQGQGGYLYFLIFGTCVQTCNAAFIFTAAYFPELNESFRKILNVITGIQIKLAVVHVVSHGSSQVVEPLSQHKSAQLDDWQQQMVDLRTHMRSNDKIHLSIWNDQSICLYLQNVLKSCSWRLQKTQDNPFLDATMNSLWYFCKYHRYRFKSCQWWEIRLQQPFLCMF